MPIALLPPEVTAQIAAGEVIERPASVVKELVENALDGGATQVVITVRGGGLHLIRVQDNGCGIPGAEAELAFQRYATSKIASAQDLQGIASLGFRGEALPSITAVAQVELLTRCRDEPQGLWLCLRGGRVVQREPRAPPPGTTVTVRHLFREVPARLKFLKARPAEAGRIGHVVSQYALAYPEVSFTLRSDDRETLRTPGHGEPRATLNQVYGPQVGQQLLELEASAPIDAPETGPLVRGFISPPALHRASRSYLSFFVNRRWVQSRLLTFALEEAYRGMLPSGRHPLAAVFVDLLAEEVDVNVHPAKAEVRFRSEGEVFRALQRAVRSALLRQAPVPTIQVAPLAPAWAGPRNASPTSPLPIVLAAAPQPLAPHTPSPDWPGAPASPSPGSGLPLLRVLGQMHSTYIIAEGPDGMYLIDQHAAHERVLLERILAAWEGAPLPVQPLLEPLTLELSSWQMAALEAHREGLATLGFGLEDFGGRTVLLRSVPALLVERGMGGVFLALLDELAQSVAAPGWREGLAISLACHGAIRAGQSLSLEEMRELVRQLEAAGQPRTCPHGRPTTIHLSASQLEREFGRR